jgi:hypothetical protein
MLMTAMFCLLVASEANSQAMGKTEVKIGNPGYQGNPVNQATVPITMELDNTTKGFLGYVVEVKTVPTILGIGVGILSTQVPVTLPLAAPPAPGGGPVTINISFPVEKGTTYQIDVRMDYTNAAGKAAFTNDQKRITP